MAISKLAFIFGLLGNIVSFWCSWHQCKTSSDSSFGPTFYAIYKKKSSDGYQLIPYAVALSSASLLLYYGVLKTDATMIISINAIGIVIELGRQHINVIGWICAAFNVAMFAAPLSMRRVIKTKSVEFMPFTLSFFLTFCATTWFFYGLFVKDMFIALPNTLGFLFGITQMILYIIYKDGNKKMEETNERNNRQEMSLDMKKMTSIPSEKLYPTSQHQPEVAEVYILFNGKPDESNDNV
ncbi:hypothetical protein BT93_L2730 [Corymbia citriodora subsp. variegata]|uniref:Bidirectional sugar transporter SWEET n=1 Tax=Corymbia citriodora subsp. variegata TaxID=360336 RepID=A0A8T0CNN4_CORYI|nr:hypothetical protein BT93_L2730 [Corymbia citriodora subsp. variegata]